MHTWTAWRPASNKQQILSHPSINSQHLAIILHISREDRTPLKRFFNGLWAKVQIQIQVISKMCQSNSSLTLCNRKLISNSMIQLKLTTIIMHLFKHSCLLHLAEPLETWINLGNIMALIIWWMTFNNKLSKIITTCNSYRVTLQQIWLIWQPIMQFLKKLKQMVELK